MKGFSYPFDIAIFDAGLAAALHPRAFIPPSALNHHRMLDRHMGAQSLRRSSVAERVPPALFSGGGKPGATNADHQAGLLWSEGASQRPQTRHEWWPGPVSFLRRLEHRPELVRTEAGRPGLRRHRRQTLHPAPARAPRNLLPQALRQYPRRRRIDHARHLRAALQSPAQLRPLDHPPLSQFNNNNIGTGCWNEEAFLAEPNRADAFLDPAARRNVLVVSPNVNSHNSCIRAFGLTKIDNPKTAVELLKKYVAQRRQAGWTVWSCPPSKPSTTGPTPGTPSSATLGRSGPTASSPSSSIPPSAPITPPTSRNRLSPPSPTTPTAPTPAPPIPPWRSMSPNISTSSTVPRQRPVPRSPSTAPPTRSQRRTNSSPPIPPPPPHPHPPRLHPLPRSPPHHRKPRLRQHRHPPGQHRHLRQHRSRHLLQRLRQHQLLRIPALHPDHQGSECHRPAPVRVFKVIAGGLTLQGNSSVFGAKNPSAHGIAGGSCTWLRE